MGKPHALVGLALAALSFSALTGCGSNAEAGADDGKLEKTKLKVGGLPLADYATLYWAKDKGFFKKNGLDVTIVPLQGGPIGVQQVAAGQLDFSFTNTISSAIAQSKSTPITTVVLGSSLASDEMGIFVKPDSPIKSMADLDGKSVGVNTTNNMGDVTFKNLAASSDTKVEPKWIEVPFPEMVDGVKAGSIDAGYVPEPFKSAAEAAGLREVVDLASGPNEGLAASTYIASNDFVKKNPDTTEAFVTAMYAANADLAASQSDLRSWLPGIAGVDQKTAQSMVLPSFDQKTDLDKLSVVADMLKKQGLVPEDFDPAKHTYIAKG